MVDLIGWSWWIFGHSSGDFIYGTFHTSELWVQQQEVISVASQKALDTLPHDLQLNFNFLNLRSYNQVFKFAKVKSLCFTCWWTVWIPPPPFVRFLIGLTQATFLLFAFHYLSSTFVASFSQLSNQLFQPLAMCPFEQLLCRVFTSWRCHKTLPWLCCNKHPP